MDTILLNSKVTRKEDIVAANMDGEVVMMNIETGRYYNLGTMGSVIWAMINETVAVESMVTTLLERYEVTKAQCEADVLKFLNQMSREGLLDVS